MDFASLERPIVIQICNLFDIFQSEAKRLEKSCRVDGKRRAPLLGEISIDADVFTGRRKVIEVSLRLNPEDILSTCDDCGECDGVGCEHALLVLSWYFGLSMEQLGALCASALRKKAPVAPKGGAGSPQGKAGAMGGKTASESAHASAPRRAYMTSQFVVLVEEKLGRQMTVSEEAFIKSVEALYQKNASSRMFTADALNPFLGAKPLPAWDLVDLWPDRPKSEWDAWLYLCIFMQGRGVKVPEFMGSITTPAELAALAGEWQSQRALRHWEDGLETLLDDMEELEQEGSLEVRLMFGASGAQLQSHTGDAQWKGMNDRALSEAASSMTVGLVEMSAPSRLLLMEVSSFSLSAHLSYARAETRERLGRILLNPILAGCSVNAEGAAFALADERLVWRIRPDTVVGSDYLLELVFEEGERPEEPLFSAGGLVNCYVTAEKVYRSAPLLSLDPAVPLRIPAMGLLSGKAVQLLTGLGVALPENLAQRVVREQAVVKLVCRLQERSGEEVICVRASSQSRGKGEQVYTDQGWQVVRAVASGSDEIVILEESRLRQTAQVLKGIGVNRFRVADEFWERLIGKRFPEEFSAWLESLPPGFEIELNGELASLRNALVSGSIKLDLEETSPDWFDLQVALSLSDTELTKEEIRLLLDARGKFVRLKDKGWRKLEFEFGDEEADHLSELGINPLDFGGPPQRFHALQLAASSASALLEEEARKGILRRAEDIHTSVTPTVPAAIRAQMREYQVQGFHFLTYLSSNNFGGILADDMGLGKTLQTLAWIAWLRENPDFENRVVLVVCPKSVVQNWITESERFLPGLRVVIWRGGDSKDLRTTMAKSDMVVINYAQLRMSAEQLRGPEWGAVVLDEAQYIKNPSSQTAVAACCLRSARRLALSGTPIENRLLDLWSIMHFAMPGLLGLRAHFNKQYDSRTDSLARRRLATRIRPFILRRAKSEVAKDLPARIEEDVVVELEGVQSQMYKAELKRARQALLKIKSNRELDKQRFNVLTSLLRLRQICCHPGLASDEQGHADSAKMEALVDLLEPLLERGQKVLVFSQFVEMLSRIEREVDARSWTSFLLTGETEERGELVESFQKHDGPAVFLISLRAGGMGLNLTAASYVVLFDPWWNPAVENQAIDRTHRIGQTQQVIAYRLVTKQSVEEKIRQLQRTKSAMAGDILGEEAFGKALTLSDFQFLLED